MVLIAACAVAVVVVIGATLVVVAVRAELVNAADDLAEARAEQVAGLARRGVLPQDLGEAHDVEAAVQVVQDGRIVSSTVNSEQSQRFPLPPQQPGEDEVVAMDALPVDDSGPFRVTALGTRTPTGSATVFVAVDVEDIDDVTLTLARYGALGLLGMLIGVSGVLWVVIGRTLAPVEAIRRRADLITGHQLHRRVPEPAQRDEIGRLARTINGMLARLENSAWRQERFVADAAHELRTPLASLRTRLETDSGAGLRDDDLVPDLLHDVVRMTSVVDHLLLLARSDAGRLRSDAHPVDLDEVVGEVLVATHTGDLEVGSTGVTPVQVTGDPSLLEHVFRNLLENALDHARSRVDVALHQVGDQAVLTVDDDGPGIPPELREDVFERFVRLDESRMRGRAGAGLGLGLAIVADLVNVHRGSVEITESPLGGARFQVFLPLPTPSTAAASTRPRAKHSSASPPSERSGSSGSRPPSERSGSSSSRPPSASGRRVSGARRRG